MSFINQRNTLQRKKQSSSCEKNLSMPFGKLKHKKLRIHTTNLSTKNHFKWKKSTFDSWIREIAEECETIHMNYDKPQLKLFTTSSTFISKSPVF